jgi:hypothetical protein
LTFNRCCPGFDLPHIGREHRLRDEFLAAVHIARRHIMHKYRDSVMVSGPAVSGAPSANYQTSKVGADHGIDVRHRMRHHEAMKPEAYKSSLNYPILRISASDLDKLMTTLEVSFVTLSECLVSPG